MSLGARPLVFRGRAPLSYLALRGASPVSYPEFRRRAFWTLGARPLDFKGRGPWVLT